MSKFEDAGPLLEAGEVINRRRIRQFFTGTVLLTALVLIFAAICVRLFTDIWFPIAPYLIIIGVSLLAGIGGTVLAIQKESDAVFVPYLRIAPEDGLEILRTPETVDEENYEYHVILPTENDFVLRFQGLGPSHEELRIRGVRQQDSTQIDYDKGRFVEVSRAIYIRSVSLS